MNNIIEQIHSEFSSAEETLMKEVNSFLKKSEDADKDKLSQLASLGFSSFRELREVQPEEVERVKDLKRKIELYTGQTTLYKFITEEKVIEICKKWGLVHAPVELYTDTIPYKNQQEILEFQKWTKGKEEILSSESLRKSDYTRSATSETGSSTYKEKSVAELFETFILLISQYERPLSTRMVGVGPSPSTILRQMGEAVCDILREFYKRKMIKKEDVLMYSHAPGSYIPFYISYAIPLSTNSTNINTRLVNGRSTYDLIQGETINHPSDTRTLQMKPLQSSSLLSSGVLLFLKEISSKPEYSIVAAKHMVNLEGYIVNEDFQVVEESKNLDRSDILEFFLQDDPVVLYRVEGGYYISSAWGDEAQDENVVNQNMN